MQDFVGLLLPPVIDFLNQKIANSQVRFFVSLLICTLVAAVLNYEKILDGDLSTLPTKLAIVFTEAQLVYKLYWEKSRVRVKVYGRAIAK